MPLGRLVRRLPYKEETRGSIPRAATARWCNGNTPDSCSGTAGSIPVCATTPDSYNGSTTASKPVDEGSIPPSGAAYPT